jgi:histidyl-tRNA synthetase
LKEGKVTVRDMVSGEQDQIDIDHIINHLKGE